MFTKYYKKNYRNIQEETLKQIRLKEKKEKEKQQEREKQKQPNKEKIRSMFWELKTHVDDFWDHTEYKIADKLNICISEVFRALKRCKVQKLKTLRNKNLEAAMNRLQLQNSISMSKSTRINTTQAVMLSLSVYKHDTAREKLIYSANVERPNDILPEALPVHHFSHMHYLVQQLEEHEEEQAEEMEAQKQEA